MPVKTKKNEVVKVSKQVHSLTQESRNALRSLIFQTEDKREFKPLDYALIRPIVKDEYLDIFDNAVESGKKCSVEIDLNKGFDSKQPITENAGFKFVHAWLASNGKNRKPKDTHYGMLASGFRKEFSSDATHWVIDSNGMNANGGHSGCGVALGYYPPCVEYGVFGNRIKLNDVEVLADTPEGKAELEEWNNYPGYNYVDSEGYVCETSALTWKGETELKRVGEYDDDGQYIYGTDSPDVRLKQDLTIVLRINADPTSCLKMDDVRLEASYDDYLQMVAPIRAFVDTLPTLVKEKAGEIFLNYYKRINHPKGSFGSLGKGGRPTKNEVQNWFIAGCPALLDCIELLRNKAGQFTGIFPHFKKPDGGKGGKGGISIMQALVAMMVSSPTGRERIAKVITEQYAKLSDAPPYFQKMIDYICIPRGVNQVINSDMIVSTLVLLGEGSTDPVAKMNAAYPGPTKDKEGNPIQLSPWQVEGNRAQGWDRSNTDSLVEEEFTTVCIKAAKTIAEILGNEGAVKNAKMKATRKGVGSRGPRK